MTNTSLLEKQISDSGMRKNFIMKQTGIKSYATLRAKIGNKNEFTASEIEKLCEILHLTRSQREAIFFAQ